MKQFWYQQILEKLEEMLDRITISHEPAVIVIGREKIFVFDILEAQDLLVVWKDKAPEKWEMEED